MMCCSPAEPMDGVEIITFGCRLNAAESEAMRSLIASPPFRGEREGPTPKAWEAEVGVRSDTRPKSRARACLQVQQGCDHRCTFCIIPYARGPSRSVPCEAIAAGAPRLTAEGV